MKMKLSKQSLRKRLREVYEEEKADGAIGHAAEKMAQMLQKHGI